MKQNTYEPIDRCIYCGETERPPSIGRFTDEHIIPLALGGNLILPQASCKNCEKLINKEIESPILAQEWRTFRDKYKLSTRNKKNRKGRSHKIVVDKKGNPFEILLEQHSAPLVVYKYREARLLSGLEKRDNRYRWLPLIITSSEEEVAMQREFPTWDQTHNFKMQPFLFARFIAKIAHGYATAEFGIDRFTPLCNNIILGQSDDYFNFVGGEWDIATPIPGSNHITGIELRFLASNRASKTESKPPADHALIVIKIRLFPQISMPSYHVVAGVIDLTNPFHVKALEEHRSQGKLLALP